MKVLTGQSWRIGCHASEAVIGRAVIVRTHADLSKVNKGDVLVALQTDVNYTPQMIEAAAVITEDGGRYSHAVTFSRENNIPCIIGTIGILNELTDGDMICVDTYKKTISIITTLGGDL